MIINKMTIMNKNELRSTIMDAIGEEVDAWLAEEKDITDPIHYERQALSRTLKMGRALVEMGQGQISADRNKKNEF